MGGNSQVDEYFNHKYLLHGDLGGGNTHFCEHYYEPFYFSLLLERLREVFSQVPPFFDVRATKM